MKEEYILCNDITKWKTTCLAGSNRERTRSYLKTKKKGMQKIEQKTEEKYGVDKRLCNATHEWHLEPFFLRFSVFLNVTRYVVCIASPNFNFLLRDTVALLWYNEITLMKNDR